MAAYISFQPSDNYNTLLYTGTGATRTVTGAGFQPDFTWIKQRDGTYVHQLYDSVRGAGYHLRSDDGAAQSALDTAGLSAWTSDGFTVNTRNQVNYNTGTFASYNWKAGTTTGITGSPSITPGSYSFNATAGQSIIKYTGNATAGATIPHGLGIVPELILFKNLTDTEAWGVYSETIGNGKKLVLNTTEAEVTQSTAFNNTSPTATLVSLGTHNNFNGSSKEYIAYCFASIKGYSKMGSFIGNADSNGPFCFCGFRPAFVMIKNTNAVEAWNTWNDKTSTSGKNVADKNLQPNATTAEQTSVTGVKEIDIVSNGFKVRGSNSELNGSANTLTYAAFAEFPFVSSNSIPGLAR